MINKLKRFKSDSNMIQKDFKEIQINSKGFNLIQNIFLSDSKMIRTGFNF